MTVDKPAGQRADSSEDAISPVAFRVDTRSGVPVYLQLVNQVNHALRLGYRGRVTSSPESETWLDRCRSTRTQ